jgi:hypothetical protein
MKYSKLVKLAQDTQTPWRGLLERATRRPSALAPAQGRQERGSAGAGLGYVGSAYGNQIAGGIEGQLAEYAPAQGRQERGSAGAGLGYAGSAYGAQIAEGVKGRLARALARFRKTELKENYDSLTGKGLQTPRPDKNKSKSPYTEEGLKTKRKGQQTPRDRAALVQSGYLKNSPGPAPVIEPGAENQRGLGRSGQGALMLEELNNFVPPTGYIP